MDDIWNMDETGIFWRALPDKGFGERGKACKGGKKGKIRVTVALFVTASGKKEKAIVINKSETPRCLKGFDKSMLPVTYFSQKKAWMTSEILDKILSKLNTLLSCQNWSILLLLDNAGCHPDHFKEKYSNINICFLPANTTSKLQPLDLGIIQNFKVHYRRLLLRYILSKIDECDSATEVANSINILVAIRWIALAWEEVKVETICKCFKKAGVLDSGMEVVSCNLPDYPFQDLVDNDDAAVGTTSEEALQELIDQFPTTTCTAQEYTNGEELQTCQDIDDDTWGKHIYV